MDLFTVILFLILYYLRPQEWAGMFSSIHFVQIVMLSGLACLVFRERSVRLRDFFRTPHDWAVLAFWLWMVAAAPHPWDTFKETANLYVFYVVIVQTLYSIPRMKVFALSWTLLIVAVAWLALASKWGFDPLDSLAITNGSMRGRLMLNLSIFNNPNGLGHSVVPAIPMLYYYFIWKRPVAQRVLGIALLTLPLYCIYLTLSKGSFVCAAITIFATAAFGRPKSVQVLLLLLALVFGTGALYSLPRMNELNKSRSDEAIQGRVAAFRHGFSLLEKTHRGIGKGEWVKDPFITDYIPKLVASRDDSQVVKSHVVMQVTHYNKAPHSSYVCIGAELGKPGLFLFFGVLYCCLRTTITARTQTSDEERIRRILFVLVVSYMVSSWMVDFEYRPTFFMFAAAIGALHRHLLGLFSRPAAVVETSPADPLLPVWSAPELLAQPAFAGLASHSMLTPAIMETVTENSTPPSEPRREGVAKSWNRISWFDLLVILLLTWGAIRFWAYLILRM